MTQKEQLWEKYEDAVFAILMDAVAEQEGKRGLQLMEELEHDPSAQVPEEVQRKAEKTIRKAFAAKNRKSMKHFTFKVAQRIAVAVLVVVITTACAFAAFPEVRANVLNTIIRTFEDHTEFEFSSMAISGNKPSRFTIELNWMPDGFILTDEGEDQLSTWQRYTDKNDQTKTIYISEDALSGQSLAVDTENADVTKVEIQGYEGTLITKEAWNCILYTVPEQSMVVHLQSEFIPVSDIIKVAENINLN